MKHNIPKVKFEVAPLDSIFHVIHHFLNPPKKQWDWSSAIYNAYPDLSSRISGIKDKKKRREAEYAFFRETYEKEMPLLEKQRDEYQSEWDRISDKVMDVFTEVIEQEWPDKDTVMHARVSLNPICPRFIKTRTFDVYYKQDSNRMKATAIHELLHFIYFEKWKSIFPETKPREFDSPYLVWHLSEMVPRVILNDKRFQDIFQHEHGSYKVYEKATIEGKPLLSYLQGFYDQRTNFEDFLRKSWQFVQSHKKEIKAL
jgi:hypothetical protein